MLGLVGVLLLVLVAAGLYAFFVISPLPPAATSTHTSEPLAPVPVAEASSEQVHQFCGYCHVYPPPEVFPQSAWRQEVIRAYGFFDELATRPRGLAPSLDSVVAYYEKRAPSALPRLEGLNESGPPPVRFERLAYRFPGDDPAGAVSNVNLVHLFNERKLDVLVCDMDAGRVMALKPCEPAPALEVLAHVPHPAHAEVVDLDGDGVKDLIIANLGSMTPTDDAVGSVVWLRGLGNGKFQSFTLLDGVGRVADVQAADFNGDGKLDLIVAVFGWQRRGEIIYLENRTSDWSQPRFVPHIVDARHGAIHVPVCDLNKDGKPDFVALISQEHETIVAFLNKGNGEFDKKTIYTAPHPAYGSSGIQLVDLNGDGRLDVLYTNGDVLDAPFLLKPYHSVQWLENKGEFPFVHHHLTNLYGVHRAVAADLRGTGLLDIVAVSFLPGPRFRQRQELGLDSVILLEQTAPGRFVRHGLEKVTCDHVTCALGDLDGTGKIDLVVGNFALNESAKPAEAITIWKNLGRR
jgi:hypothetical protein